MKSVIALQVNGQQHEIAIPPSRSLLEALRDDLGLTGAKNGCGVGDCGCCTVLLDGEPVNACLVLAVEAQGREVLTIEGLEENGKLHPLQRAFIDKGDWPVSTFFTLVYKRPVVGTESVNHEAQDAHSGKQRP